jgi:hypothetical protein
MKTQDLIAIFGFWLPISLPRREIFGEGTGKPLNSGPLTAHSAKLMARPNV